MFKYYARNTAHCHQRVNYVYNFTDKMFILQALIPFLINSHLLFNRDVKFAWKFKWNLEKWAIFTYRWLKTSNCGTIRPIRPDSKNIRPDTGYRIFPLSGPDIRPDRISGAPLNSTLVWKRNQSSLLRKRESRHTPSTFPQPATRWLYQSTTSSSLSPCQKDWILCYQPFLCLFVFIVIVTCE